MKEAVDDIMVTLNEAASEVGMVGGMVDSIAEAMSKVSIEIQTPFLFCTWKLIHIVGGWKSCCWITSVVVGNWCYDRKPEDSLICRLWNQTDVGDSARVNNLHGCW